MQEVTLKFEINGQEKVLKCHPMARLLDVLRENAGLTGSKEGCGEGECGACGIMIEGRLVNSCLIPAVQAGGTKITTIEGVSENGELNKVQKSFWESGGAQCGICTPGMVMASIDLLKRYPDPTEEQIREGLAGNLCRCTGYMKIFDSVKKAARL